MLISFERITGYFLLTNAQYAIIAFSAIFVSIGLNIQSMMSSYFFPLMAKRHLDEGNIALIKQGTFYTISSILILGSGAFILLFISANTILNIFNELSLTNRLLWLIIFLSVLRASDFVTNIFLLLGKQAILVKLRLSIITLCLFTLNFLKTLIS